MIRVRRAAAVIATCMVTCAPNAAAAAPNGTELFRFQDSRIDEASGIAVAALSPHTVFVQNDSGDSARFFAVDTKTGKTRAVYTVPQARNVDWEDIATSDIGRPYLWLADIGDNRAQRSSIQLYRVDEPVLLDTTSGTLSTSSPTVWDLRYPDGPHDAESFIVDGLGHAFILTKSLVGSSGVYEVPMTPTSDVQVMRKVGEVRLLLATGACFRDNVLVIRTYADAYVWPAEGGVVAALASTPRRISLPAQKQGEGIAISVDDDALIVDSEGKHQPVYSVPFARFIHDSPPTLSDSAGPYVVHRKHGLTGLDLLLILGGSSVAFFAVGFAVAGLVVLVRRRRRV